MFQYIYTYITPSPTERRLHFLRDMTKIKMIALSHCPHMTILSYEMAVHLDVHWVQHDWTEVC